LLGLGQGMMVNPNFTGVLCGDLRVGTHITINYQLPDGIRHLHKLVWNGVFWNLKGQFTHQTYGLNR